MNKKPISAWTTVLALALIALLAVPMATAAQTQVAKGKKIGCNQLKPGLKKRVCKGKVRGPAGQNGVDGKDGSPGAPGVAGPAGAAGPEGQEAPPTYGNPHWSVMDRNVEGAATAYLRAGPSTSQIWPHKKPPLGEGSLGLSVADGNSKVDFGNEVNYRGKFVSDLTAVGYTVFTTQENSDKGVNMPSIRFEIDPNGAGGTTTSFSTLVWTPTFNTSPSVWTQLDATVQGLWGLTGSEFNSPATAANCGLNGPRCTFQQVKTLLANGTGAVMWTAAVGKGKDYEFHGAVDALVINDETINFEPNGVIVE